MSSRVDFALEMRVAGKTYRQIGAALGISTSRAQQIVAMACFRHDLTIKRGCGIQRGRLVRCRGCDSLHGHAP